MAPRRSTDNPRTLVQCKKWWWTHATSCKEGSKSRGRRAGTGKAAWAEKTVSKRSFDTSRASSKFLEQATRGIGGLQRFQVSFMGCIKLRRFWTSDHHPQKKNSGCLCKCVCGVICNSRWHPTFVGQGKEGERDASTSPGRLTKTRVACLH